MAEAQILVVDDEVGMVRLLRNSLTREGYAVTTAPSAEVALQVLEEHDIDVVLTDLRMPGMGGIGTRARHPHIPARDASPPDDRLWEY